MPKREIVDMMRKREEEEGEENFGREKKGSKKEFK